MTYGGETEEIDMPIVEAGPLGNKTYYPLVKLKRYHNIAITFLDGSRQCFQSRRAPAVQWHLTYEKQEERIAHEWMGFLNEAMQGVNWVTFADPATGLVHEKCRLSDHVVSIEQKGFNAASFEISVRSEDV